MTIFTLCTTENRSLSSVRVCHALKGLYDENLSATGGVGGWPRDDQVFLIICFRDCLCLSDFMWRHTSGILTVRNKTRD